MAAPSTGLVFLLHHLTDEIITMYATKSGKENDVKKCPTIELQGLEENEPKKPSIGCVIPLITSGGRVHATQSQSFFKGNVTKPREFSD